jgi:hypothetical protein
MQWPNEHAPGKGGIPSLSTVARARPALAEHRCSAGAGVESVVVVDFRNGIADGVLKQQC